MKMSQFAFAYMDIVWFAYDRAGRVCAFFALGDGNIPAFVSRSKEETEALFEALYGGETGFADAFDFRHRIDREVFLQKGLYVCVLDDPYEGSYRLAASPEVPCTEADLSPEVRAMMADHRLDVDVLADERLEVPEE